MSFSAEPARDDANRSLIAAFRRASSSASSAVDVDAQNYRDEMNRIDAATQELWRERPHPFIPAVYLRHSNPDAEEALRLLRVTSKAFELNLRFREIEQLDEMHAKLWSLLSADKSAAPVTPEAYAEIVARFQSWHAERFPATTTTTTKATTATVTERRERSPAPQNFPNEATPLGDVLFLRTARPPRPSAQLFLACPRLGAGAGVDAAHIYQRFAKQVSLVKSEAELMMWDTNNDGRLTEDEMESYVRDLVPRVDALRDLTEDILPFYCCTVSRRIFWALDSGSRGTIRIDALLQSPVMDEWMNLQLMREPQPRNWFSSAVTLHLYDKFLLLDTRNKGTLNAENMKRYKKGLPTVTEDGLPSDISPLSSLFIDRFFETNVMMTNSELDFRKFVDFVVAVELLPQCQRPLFFWNILDIGGKGALSPVHVNYFFRETHNKLVSAGLEVPSRETVVQEAFDLIATSEPLRISREEFLNAPQAGLFVALLIDCLSFWTYETREQR